MTSHIILIRGPLGVGKTTVAKLLAKRLKAKYLSLDKILEDNNLDCADGIPVKNFLKANEIIKSLIKNCKNPVVLDGCFYYQKQVDDLKLKFGLGLTIFTLVSSVEKCIERDSKRKKVYGEDSARFVHSITTKIKAGHEIDTENLTVEETVEKIFKKLQ
jgi:cytidylate kinase